MNFDSALILAGGQSTRMGYDKKQLELAGAKVIDRLIAGLGSIFNEVLVSSNQTFINENVRVLMDGLGRGPLAGIYQGLIHCKSDYLYVIACDMPFLSVEYIQYMRKTISAEAVDACIARRRDGFYEPFNSFFSKQCIPCIGDALTRQEYKIRPLLDKLNLHIIEPSTIDQYKGDMFFNINYIEDLERAESIMRGQLPQD
ncbi:MAG: molybdenum cofactor guanylyltransferase [Treponema sp.]|jgi:molybdopterin-guanine dinucleotide biosynthesis protein A|nr:molybdenum cofactor guanylyltransferase [Treponema sp.]